MTDEGAGWPSKVFLESPVLFRLGARLENVDFAEMLRLRDLLKFQLFVPEVSWREYLRRRGKEVRDCVAKIRQCRADLGKHDQPVAELEEAEKKALAHFENVSEHFSKRAQTLGITMVPTPVVDLRVLLEMSLANDPPFEDSQSENGEKTKEKGFRDALIMFTILAEIENQPGGSALIVTGDKRLSDGLRVQAEKQKMKLVVVEDLQKAISHIEATLTTWYRGAIKREAEEAKSMLLRYRDQLSKRIQEIKELTDSELGQGPMAGILYGEEPRLNIHELRSLAFDDVESAVWQDGDKDKSRILFRVRCRAHVIATEQPQFFWSPTSFAVGGGKTSANRFTTLASLNPKSIERDLPVRLYGEAQLERLNGDWQLMSLKVDKSLPDSDWEELQKISIQLK